MLGACHDIDDYDLIISVYDLMIIHSANHRVPKNLINKASQSTYLSQILDR